MNVNKQLDINPFEYAKAVLEDIQNLCYSKFGFKIPLELEFRTRGGAILGEARFTYKPKRIHKIRLSKIAIEQMNRNEIKELVIHEFAHLLSKYLFGDHIKPHGKEWKQCVRDLGGKDTNATASYPWIKLRETDVLAKCKCSCKYHFITKKIADEILGGCVYLCGDCKRVVKIAKEKDIIKFESLMVKHKSL